MEAEIIHKGSSGINVEYENEILLNRVTLLLSNYYLKKILILLWIKKKLTKFD